MNEMLRSLFYQNKFDSISYRFVHNNSSFKDVKPPILNSLVISYIKPVISYIKPNEYESMYGFIGRVIGLDRSGMDLLPLGVLNKNVPYNFQGSVYKPNDKIYPILVTEELVIQLGFVPYNIKGFKGYRIKIGGIYLKIKLKEYPVAGFILKLGSNTYSGIYLHQLMEILNLYFLNFIL